MRWIHLLRFSFSVERWIVKPISHPTRSKPSVNFNPPHSNVLNHSAIWFPCIFTLRLITVIAIKYSRMAGFNNTHTHTCSTNHCAKINEPFASANSTPKIADCISPKRNSICTLKIPLRQQCSKCNLILVWKDGRKMETGANLKQHIIFYKVIKVVFVFVFN